MSYADALAFLDDHSNYDVSGRIASPTLGRMQALVHALGDPHLAHPVVHVTGTNGKGSTTQMISRLLMAQGLSELIKRIAYITGQGPDPLDHTGPSETEMLAKEIAQAEHQQAASAAATSR